ncbi:hypothetical protein VNO78_14296 [Psophocarpus tetragonolobus]|uniref:Uncharacterized protein n=1 Tax=Psophocarpus tetragonolobus TaxID=3891 RepID=A0AAN9SS30_PSOTE
MTDNESYIIQRLVPLVTMIIILTQQITTENTRRIERANDGEVVNDTITTKHKSFGSNTNTRIIFSLQLSLNSFSHLFLFLFFLLLCLTTFQE